MKYKGYTARVSFDADEQLLIGRVEHIRDVVTFQAESVAELEKEFRISVDEYLAFCQERGSPPEKPLGGGGC